jgi:hypothetical protein
VNRDAVVPNSRSLGSPSEPDLNIHVLFINVIEIIQKQVAFRLVQTNDSHRHGAVDPEGLPTGHGVDTNERMSTLDVFRTSGFVATFKLRLAIGNRYKSKQQAQEVHNGVRFCKQHVFHQ